MTISVGESITIKATFYDNAVPPNLYNPSTVVATAKRPTGEKVTLSVAHPSPGVFTATVDGDYVGDWQVKIASTAPGEKKSAIAAFTVVSDGF